jgi:hypothetical protein
MWQMIDRENVNTSDPTALFVQILSAIQMTIGFNPKAQEFANMQGVIDSL